MASVNGIALAATAAGALFLWSGIRGGRVLVNLQDLIQGRKPADTGPGPVSTGGAGTAPVSVPGGRVLGLGNVPVPSSGSQKAWAGAQLAAVGALPTPANVTGMCAWANRESPWNASPPDGAEYTHNPLNTTDQTGAVGEVNSVNVAIYPNWAAGIAATAATLQGYPDILARLRSGKGLCGWSSPEFSTWSGGGYDSVC